MIPNLHYSIMITINILVNNYMGLSMYIHAYKTDRQTGSEREHERAFLGLARNACYCPLNQSLNVII